MINKIFEVFNDKGQMASLIVGGIIGAVITGVIWLIKTLMKNQGSIWFQIRLFFCKNVRLSISYLFRISIDGKYLLIRGNRINQYQPVGGVYKYYDSAKSLFNNLGVHPDTNIKIDEDNKKDLRIRVKGRNVIKVIKWFHGRENREVCVIREFYEELILDQSLDESFLKNFKAEFIRNYTSDLHYSSHFKCKEILIADIFEIILEKEQEEKFKKLISTSKNLILVDREDIEKECILINGLSEKIGENSKWIL